MDRSHTKSGKGSLLIADDDLSAHQTLPVLMETEGYEVRCAPSGQTALMFAGEEPPEQNIKLHRAHIMKKVGVESLADLVRAAERLSMGQ